jgi:hypothetical protein
MCLIEKELWCRSVLKVAERAKGSHEQSACHNAAPGFRKHHQSERGENMEMKNEA